MNEKKAIDDKKHISKQIGNALVAHRVYSVHTCYNLKFPIVAIRRGSSRTGVLWIAVMQQLMDTVANLFMCVTPQNSLRKN